ncbi:outer membrane protein [Rhizobium sp. L1K21]|uniref:outer membrane protein n=1 Tax=Rhizobium sp. L1K21 TaxID=2954933 RepID=UPI0020937E22|nr:outer membrane beta-barrel protein [Rhizobium sp. L1K21]MCO6186889.1 outer membrane beta-barrel protein [Rhizobium sp. L1K21]
MKLVIASMSAAVLFAAAGAQAADGNILSETPVSSWEGVYGGVYGGFSAQNGRSTALGTSGSSNYSGGRIGAFAGYNLELAPSTIAGLEGDFGYDYAKVKSTGAKFGPMWSVRARLGYSVDSFLIYGAAGYTGTRAEVTNIGITNRGTLNGWTVGAGADVKITENVFARAEYRFNHVTGNINVLGIPTSNRVQQHVFNVGLGFKF